MQLKKCIYNFKRFIQLYVCNSRRIYSDAGEVRKSYGQLHKDKTFYVIGVDEGWCGKFAIIVHQLTHIAYAVENGLLPVVDLKITRVTI